MKIFKKILFAFIAVSLITACSKDDEEVQPNQDLADASLEFDATNPPVEVPSTLQNSDTQEAQTIASYLASINSITSYSGYFDPPAGAETSTTPITTGSSGGRVAATQEDVLVYTWTSSSQQGSFTIAYQISQDANNYMFEVFFKYNDGDFIKVLEGAESKDDLREGYMEWFSDSGDENYVFRYEWSEAADGSFTFNYLADSFKIELNIAADGSGTIDYYSDGVIFANYTWNAAATMGTYTTYDDQGNVTSTTEWTA